MSEYICLDLETAALPNAADYIDLASFSAPANYKAADKIAANIEEQRVAALEKAALDVDLARIVAIGWQTDDGDPAIECCRTEDRERSALRLIWGLINQRTCVGFNLLQFDGPMLLRRSLYLGVPAPVLNLDKYRTPHVDLMQKLTHNGLLKARSLKFYARRFGLNVPSDPHTGADIARLVSEGDWAAVEHHCRCDILATHALAVRIGVLTPQTVQA